MIEMFLSEAGLDLRNAFEALKRVLLAEADLLSRLNLLLAAAVPLQLRLQAGLLLAGQSGPHILSPGFESRVFFF